MKIEIIEKPDIEQLRVEVAALTAENVKRKDETSKLEKRIDKLEGK